MSNNGDEEFERPAWTRFFEGTLYRRYMRYIQHHDLSQMLYSGTFTNNFRQDIKPPVLTNETSWCPPEDEMPPPYQCRLPSTSSGTSGVDKRRIKQRTRLCICLGVTFIALAAAITALVIHCFFIDTKDAVIESDLIHISGNFSTNETDSLMKDNSTSILNNTVPTEMFLPFRTADIPIVFEPITIHNVKTIIGQGQATITCTIQTENWDIAYLKGDKNVDLKLVKSKGLTSSGQLHRHSFDHELSYDNETHITKIKLEVLIRNIQCDDQSLYVCGFRDGEVNKVQSAALTVERIPDTSIDMKEPIAFIEGQATEVEATWKSGYPSPLGNITWVMSSDSNVSNGFPIISANIIWRTREKQKDCYTYLNTIITIIPTMDMNDTYLFAVPTHKDVSPLQQRILVIPGDYCDGVSGDSNEPNPYTCKTFVRCRPEKIDAYPCPENTCFIEDLSQCEKLKSIR